MSLPKSENFPDDPDLLPPARRRGARRLLAPLDADERAATIDHMAHRTSPSFDFFLFSLVAGVFFGIALLKGLALGAGDDDGRVRLAFDSLQAGEDWLRFHHHAGAATIRGVINLTVLVLAIVSGVIAAAGDFAGFCAPAYDAGAAVTIDKFREERDDVEGYFWH